MNVRVILGLSEKERGVAIVVVVGATRDALARLLELRLRGFEAAEQMGPASHALAVVRFDCGRVSQSQQNAAAKALIKWAGQEQEALEQEAEARFEQIQWGDIPRTAGDITYEEIIPYGGLARLGRLHAVEYFSPKGGEPEDTLYRHVFGEQDGEGPVIYQDARERIVLVGGRYALEERGIVG